jgi:aspartate aminotransferase
VRSIVATSHSKDLALPGERIGFVAVHPDYDDKTELMDGLVFCNRTLGFVNAPALIQHIVKNLQSVTIDVQQYQDKRDFMYDALTDIGYQLPKPQGAFYMFPKSPIEDDVEFTAELQKSNVLVVPGTGFGSPGHFRLSYCVTDETLAGSLDGFRKAFEAVS